MTAALTWKVGDRLPALTDVLTYADGTAINLTTAVSVQWRYRVVGTTGSAVTRTATVVSATTGEVRYDIVAGDTATAGEYEGEWVVTFPASVMLTVPNDRMIKFAIVAVVS